MPCVVEIDPVVSGELPMPAEVVAWVDRCHRSLETPVSSETGRYSIKQARRLANMLNSMNGISILAGGFARTIPLSTPLEASELIERAERRGLSGIRALPEIAGGIAITVDISHDHATLVAVAAALEDAVGKGTASHLNKLAP